MRVCLIGVGGYGRVHLQHLLQFHREGRVSLVAVVVHPPDSGSDVLQSLAAIPCEIFPDFPSLCAALPRLQLQLAVVPTPIHLHAPMTLALLDAGLNVLVEKPIAATLREAHAIAERAAKLQRMVAVGFQYLHAPEIQALKQRLLAGTIGPLRRVVVHAAWPRSHAYYARNDWAGRLQLGEQRVFDSPINNAISHFFMLMLFLAGRTMEEAAEPVRLTAELYRAQAIESFDTGVVRLETDDGCRLDFYGTHSSREIERPSLVIEGSAGRAEWVQDTHALIIAHGKRWELRADPESATRERMFNDVFGRLEGHHRFVCTPQLAAAHVRCVTALHENVPITPVPPAWLQQRIDDGDTYTFVRGLDGRLSDAARCGSGLAGPNADWAVPGTVVALTSP
ncbi:MAG: Gfo/Idh/MocA family oxidoreductase [Opitutus sp.]